MLRVRIDIVPSGDQDKAHEIAELEIWNTGGPEEAATYSYELRLTEPEVDQSVAGTHVVHNRDHGALELIRIVLDKLRTIGVIGPCRETRYRRL